ncbi:MAG: hypothetical protein WAV90_13180 [Gordonia amarae]
MDWVAIASVTSSGAVAVVTLVANGLMRRGDRKHTASLEFEKRVCEAKSTALLDLIDLCQRIIGAISSDPKRDKDRVRFAVLETFDGVHYRVSSPALVAYGSSTVNAAVSELQLIMSHVARTDAATGIVEAEWLKESKESAIDEHDFQLAATRREQEKNAEQRIGALSEIDLDAVGASCANIIVKARADLRGA